MSYFCTSSFLAILYLSVEKRSKLIFVLVCVVFLLSIAAHRKTVIFLVYPVCWMGLCLLSRFDVKGVARTTLIGIGMVLLLMSGVGYSIIGDSSSLGSFGGWFLEISTRDGIPLTLYHPFLFMLSFLLPYVLVIIILVINKRGRFRLLAIAGSPRRCWAQ